MILTNGSTLENITYDIYNSLHRISISLNSVNPNNHKLIHGYSGVSKYNDILQNIKRLLKYPPSTESRQVKESPITATRKMFSGLLFLCE